MIYTRLAIPGGDTDRAPLGAYTIHGVQYTGCYSGGGPNALVEYRDNPLAESTPDLGPIPRGWYTLELLNDGGDYENKGKLVFKLVPDEGNQMYGRGGFLIHGDNAAMNFTASDGCIITPHDLRLLILAAYHAGDNRLQVI